MKNKFIKETNLNKIDEIIFIKVIDIVFWEFFLQTVN